MAVPGNNENERNNPEYHELSPVNNNNSNGKVVNNNDNESASASSTWPDQKRYCFNKLTKPWLIVLIVFCVVSIILTFVLIGIFVIGRNVAQNSVNDSKIEISQMAIQKVGDNYMKVRMDGLIQNFAPLEASMSSSTMEMVYKGKTCAKVDLPAMTLKAAGTTELSVEQIMSVDDFKVFSDFAYDMMSKAFTDISLKGKVNVKAMGLSYSELNMEKILTIKGLNNFLNPSPKIISQTVTSGNDNELILTIDACLNNNGSMTFDDLGALKLEMLFENVVVGYTTVGEIGKKLPLLMGENCWKMTGHVVRTSKNSESVEKLVSAVASPGEITLKLRGTKGTTIYPLLASAMEKMETEASFSPLKVMATSTAPINSINFASDIDTSSYGIPSASLLQYATSNPISNLPFSIQGVFNPTPSLYDYLMKPLGIGGILGNEKIPKDPTCARLGLGKANCVSAIDLSSTTYIDIKAVVYNPLNTTLKIFGSELDVHFSPKNKWNCHVPPLDMSNPARTSYSKAAFLNTCLNVTDHCTINKAGYGSFHMARASQKSTNQPILKIPPFQKKLFYQRLCLRSISISWMNAWLNRQTAQSEAPYYMLLDTSGTLDIEIDRYRTNMKTVQEIPVYGYYYKEGGLYPYKPSEWKQ